MNFDTLTPHQHRVITLRCSGYTNAAIADSLSVTQQAVKNVLTDAYERLGIKRNYRSGQSSAVCHELGYQAGRRDVLDEIDRRLNRLLKAA